MARLPRKIWCQVEYWKCIGLEGGSVPADPEDPANGPPVPPSGIEDAIRGGDGRAGVSREYLDLVREEIAELQGNDSLDRSDRIARLGMLDLMISDRPGTRKEGLKLYMVGQDQERRRRADEAADERREALQNRAKPGGGGPTRVVASG